MFLLWMGLVGMCGCSLEVGDSIGDRGPDMLTGVGKLEFEAIDEVRSCLIGRCCTWIDAVSGDVWEPML
jgi:hypothetical protein